MALQLECVYMCTCHSSCRVMSPTVHTPLWRHAPFVVHLSEVVEACPLRCTPTCQSSCGGMPSSLYTHYCGGMPPSLYTHNCGGMPPSLYTYMLIKLWSHVPFIVHLHVNQVLEPCPLHCTHIICGGMPPLLYTHNCGGTPPSLYTHMSIKLWSYAPFIVHTSFVEVCPLCCTHIIVEACPLHCTHIIVEACPYHCTPTCQSGFGDPPPPPPTL